MSCAASAETVSSSSFMLSVAFELSMSDEMFPAFPLEKLKTGLSASPEFSLLRD